MIERGYNMLNNIDVLKNYLKGAFSLDTLYKTVEDLVDDDAEYISLNFDNPELKKIEPWCGTSYGKESYVKNFTGILNQWNLTSFDIQIEMQNDEYAMVFGSFSLKSKTLGKEASSPMCAIAKIGNNKIKKFIYLEDTLATALTFKVGGESLFHTVIGESGFSL